MKIYLVRHGQTNSNLKKVYDNVKLDEDINENGIIVIAGCSHSGICNIVEQAKKVSNNSKVLAVIGGFHLIEVDENTNKVIDYMKNNVKELILAHCTADSVCNKFVNDLKGKIKVSATEVGKIYNF